MSLMRDRTIVMIHDAMNRFCALGYLRDYLLSVAMDRDALGLECHLQSGEARHYRLTSTEIANGGPDAVEFWLGTIERDIGGRIRSWALGNAMLAQQQGFHQNSFAQSQLQQNFYHKPPDPKTNEKAEELFMLVCGKEAFDMLNSGKPLPITGSQGTKYTLHKRSTYCVERVSDNARLCAIVPNVPLFDHLLGIKLMIEHDEQKFLETANVTQGLPWNQVWREMQNNIDANRAGIAQNGMRNSQLLQGMAEPQTGMPPFLTGVLDNPFGNFFS